MIKQENIKLFLSILLFSFIPTLYSTVIFNLLGNTVVSEFRIASQIQWVNIIYEVFGEMFIAPLYFFLSGLINKIDFNSRIKIILMYILFIYIILFIFIFLYADQFILFMNQDIMLLSDTVYYIRLESFANIFVIISQFCFVIYVLKGSYKDILYFSFIKLFAIILCNILFIHYLNMGANGIAYSNITTHIVLVIYAFLNFKHINIYIRDSKITKIFTFNELFFFISKISKVGMISGFESAVRNFAYSYMVLRMVNITGKQEIFWVVVTFFWNWLLFPVIQMGEIIKKDISLHTANLKYYIRTYVLWTTFFIMIWVITIPLYPIIFKNIMNIKEYESIYEIVVISMPFYIIFSYGNIITNIFYGMGNIQYILLQSLIVNIIYYGTVFYLYYKNIIQMTLANIVIIFGISMVLGAVINFIAFNILYYKKYVNI